MVHLPSSNRTDEQVGILSPQEGGAGPDESAGLLGGGPQQSSGILSPDDPLERRPSDPNQRPVGGPAADIDLMDALGSFARSVSPAIPLIPDLSGDPAPNTAETIQALKDAGAAVPDVAEDLARFGAEAVQAAPGAAIDIATETPERAVEFATRAVGLSFLAIPAGLERALVGQPTTEPGDPEFAEEETISIGGVPILKRPFQELVAASEDAQHAVRNYFGNDESTFLNLTADVAGGYALGNQLFKAGSLANKFVVNRFSSALFRPLVSGQRAVKALQKLPAPARRLFTDPQTAGTFASRTARGTAAAAEGGLFMAGLPDTDKEEIILGVASGLLLQGGAEVAGASMTKYLRDKAAKTFPDIIDEVRGSSGDVQIEGFPAFLARTKTNLIRSAPWKQTSDEAITAIKTILSEQGETGALGVVRGMTDMGQEQIDNLRTAFPDYRFEIVGGPQIRRGTGRARAPRRGQKVIPGDIPDQKVVFGLKRDVDLPEGTRSAPSLTDRVLEDFQDVGILRDQKVLFNGREYVFKSANVEGDNVLIKPLNRGKPFRVPKDRVVPLESTAGLLKNDRLLTQFRRFRAAEGFQDLNIAYDEFWNRFLDDDISTALKPHLKRYFDEQEALAARNRMRPDEQASLERFERALRRIQRGEDAPRQNVDDFAAHRMHTVHHFADGRKKVTNELTGQTSEVFRNEDRLREYLRNIDYEDVDLTLSIPGIPDNLLQNVMMPVSRPNPSVPSKAELETQSIMSRLKQAPKTFGNWWSKHITRQIRSMEDAARVMEEKGVVDAPIWAEGMQSLSQKLRQVQNRTAPFAEELSRIMSGLDEAEQDLIEGWLRSERKSVFEARQNMPDELITKAEETRFWLDEVFNEWSAATGLNLSPDDYMRNYAPSNVNWAAQTGRMDFEEIWNQRQTTESIDELNEFFGEMWKSGEARTMAQEPLASKLSRTLRSGMFKAHAGPEFQRAVNFAKTLENGSVGQKHLVQYLNGARGRIDYVRQEMDKVFGELYSELGFPVNESGVTNIVDAAIAQSYGGLIGFRPALLARQLYQPVNLAGPILGNRRVVQAQRDALQDQHQSWARRLGILEERDAVTFFETLDADPRRASIFRLNQQARKKGLKPYSGFDKHNRVAVALATKRKLEPQLEQFRAGEINQTELLEQSGLWILDKPQRTKFFNILDGDIQGTVGETFDERAVNFAADEIGSKLTNFLYGRQNAPTWMESVPGRVFGSYSTWPRGYLNYIAHLTAADVRPGVKVAALAKHGTNNIAVATAGQTLGLNLSNWMPWNSLYFGGSPGWDQMVTMANAWGGAPWERGEAAREAAEQGFRMWVPGGQMLLGDVLPAVLDEENFRGRAGSLTGFSTLGEDRRPNLLSGPFGFNVKGPLAENEPGALLEGNFNVEVETPFGDINEP